MGIQSNNSPENRETQDRETGQDEFLTQAVELMFFAYRDFVSDPDTLLSRHGFGRAHHRVLHFVGRQPGLSIAELLSILAITKQSLSRVLRELIDHDYVEQRHDEKDGRKRLLFLTDKGRELQNDLLTPQHIRFAEALEKSDPETLAAWQSFMFQLINVENRPALLERLKIKHPKSGGD